MSLRNFARAARFLRHLAQHVQIASVSDLRKRELHRAHRVIIALEQEQAKLQKLRRHLPASPPTTPRSTPETPAEQVIHALVDRIERDYASPITLRRYARDVGMNAAYLSALFSHKIGIPFKAYLTELRLQKAKEMLSDPTKRTSEVAFAVGYSGEECFRFAFKKATGLCPKLWRETMQTTPPA